MPESESILSPYAAKVIIAVLYLPARRRALVRREAGSEETTEEQAVREGLSHEDAPEGEEFDEGQEGELSGWGAHWRLVLFVELKQKVHCDTGTWKFS